MLQLSDTAKKWAVLGSTELLPRAWRIGLRRRALARLEVDKAQATDLLIIGHPKSGNTWLRTQLSRIYQVRFGLPTDLVVTSDELHRRDSRVPRMAATNGYYSYEAAVGDLLDVDAPPNPVREKPIVFLPRNPLDIAVSWFFQFTKRQSRQKQELVNAFLERPVDKRAVDLWTFVRHSDLGIERMCDFLNTWQARVPSLPRAITISYETLRADPGGSLRRIGEHMGDPFSDAEIADAVAYGSFDNLKELERTGHFRQGGLTLRNAQDPESFKVRRAKVGGWREYFTPEQAAELEAVVAARLDPALGYDLGKPAAQPVPA